mmetsp:Transcript_18544/g.26363  ORF Transcript_18544/g.26363 Transcript_18544/m.26363 type:complete len:414 (+) Transcript_18544:88-1329(+)
MNVQSSAISATAADIGLLSTCAFLGTIGASLTGFGQAIIFLFVWQIVELAGYNGDFKSAVFIQALSLFSMQPLVLYKAKVWKNAHRRVLLLFVPITLVSTPLGQLVSDGVPTNIVQAVAGVLVTFVACWELYSKRNWFLSLSPCNRSKDEKGGETETGADDSAQTQNTAERGEAGVEVEEIGVGNGDESTEKKETTSSSTSANNAPNDDVESREEPSGKDVAATPPKTTISSVYASLAVEPDNNIDMSAAKTSTSSQTNIKPDAVQEDEERLKFGINKPTLMTLLAGGASGFLGGLVAIRGPPLIFYFLHPPHPITFNKSSQRATGVVIMFCNVLMRMIFYLVNTFSLTSSGKMGFVKEDWRLYLSVIVCSIAGGLVGSKMFEYLKDSKDTIRGILAVFLFMCGISLLFSAFA